MTNLFKPFPLNDNNRGLKYCRIIHKFCIVLAVCSLPLIIWATHNKDWVKIEVNVEDQRAGFHTINSYMKKVQYNEANGPKSTDYRDSTKYFKRSISIKTNQMNIEEDNRKALGRNITQAMAIPIFLIAYYFVSTLLANIIIGVYHTVFEVEIKVKK